MAPKDLLTTEQVGELLGVSRETVNTWIDKGHFPHAYKLDPTRTNSPYRIPRQDVDSFIRKYRPTLAARTNRT